MKHKMYNTIKLLREMNWTLSEVIQFLDSKGFSNSEVRKNVDKIINHSEELFSKAEQELDSFSEVVNELDNLGFKKEVISEGITCFTLDSKNFR